MKLLGSEKEKVEFIGVLILIHYKNDLAIFVAEIWFFWIQGRCTASETVQEAV